ncbi:ras and EF-hand domain-containing protein-like isoform X2 [Physella acuta]|uniref:ras and EF-hand domain-containing protein-like isoform X2 n=1 Tax=Physella acuta TaxID=109671 RepID=UPI0027DCEA9F|nr:ras and EF-hand domain-containing protein-like isoform X2 [Physella acuta]
MADIYHDDAAAIRSYLKLSDDENVITKERFTELFRDLSMTSLELDAIFDALDTDADDAISLDDLLKHYNRPVLFAGKSADLTSESVDSGETRTRRLSLASSEILDSIGDDEAPESWDLSRNQLSPYTEEPVRRPRSRESRHRNLAITPSDDSGNYGDSSATNTPCEEDSLYSFILTQSDVEVTDCLKQDNRRSPVQPDKERLSLNFASQRRRGLRSPSDKRLASDNSMASSDDASPNGRTPRPGSDSPRLSRVKTPTPATKQDKPEMPEAELGFLSPSSQEQVCELYQNLHSVDKPELVSQFESILLNVINDVRQYQLENERLEKTYRREKDEHDKHLRRLEEEMEQQVQSVEERVRKQEKERLESEKLELRNQLDSEIIMLQMNLKKLTQDGENKLDKNQEEHLLNLKKRLEEIASENRMLKSELTDAQTNLALIRSQMSTVKQQLDEKNYELEIGTKTLEEYLSETDKLKRQLQMLYEANKNLLDTNDNLREMLDSSPNGTTGYKRQASTDFELGALYKSGASAKSNRSLSPNFPRKGSVMSDYVDIHPGNRPLLESGMMPRFLTESCDDDNMAEDLGDHPVLLSPDSGHSTLRDLNDANDDTELDSVSVQSDIRRSRRHKRLRTGLRVQEEEEPDSHDEESDTEHNGLDSFRLPSDHKRSPSVGSRGSNRSQKSLNREESILSQSSKSSRGSMRRQLPPVPRKDVALATKVSKEPERMYKIVLAGDAAVGKSSFIVRLCKGKFVPNLSSTLGVDFQTKMLDVDGHPTALQLWDTAGQERFRSVARTYFRRADGVLLLYDVTYERSFLNLRDWVDAIETNSKEGALKKVPIMLVGNKTDARPELELQGRRVVKHDDGVRLSREIDALFIETSAKDGANITEAVIELTRLLRTNEDMEVKTVGMQLQEMKDKKSGSCCNRS